MLFCLVTSVGKRKTSKSPWGIENQTFGALLVSHRGWHLQTWRPFSMQDACHMSLLLILASRGRLTLSNTVPLSRTLLKLSFKSWIPWGKKVWQSRTIEKGWFRQVIQPLVQTGTSNRSSCITRAEHVCNHVRGQIADANFWSKLISVKKLLMSSLNLAWKFDVSIESRAKYEGSKEPNILRCWDWKTTPARSYRVLCYMKHLV